MGITNLPLPGQLTVCKSSSESYLLGLLKKDFLSTLDDAIALGPYKAIHTNLILITRGTTSQGLGSISFSFFLFFSCRD